MCIFVLGCSATTGEKPTGAIDERISIQIKNIGYVVLPEGMRDITEAQNITFAPFSKTIGRLLFVFDIDEWYVLTITKSHARKGPFILVSHNGNVNKYYFYKDGDGENPQEITREEAERILHDYLTKEKEMMIDL